MTTRTLTAGKVTTADAREKARQRAIDEGIEVRQISGTSLWVANSGTDPHKGYVLNIVDGQAVTCSCPAGEWGGYCKHRSAWEMAQEAKDDAA